MKKYLAYFSVIILILSCNHQTKTSTSDATGDSINILSYVERLDTNGLIILCPEFTKLDLRCGNMPQNSEKNIILFAEAAYTGAPLEKEFKHNKIAGDHVSHGKRYKGYKCNRNTGAFVYYSGKWKFLYKDYSVELDSAAKYGGAAFAQEMIIHKNEITSTAREDGNINTFRALCDYNNRLCIIESLNKIKFGDFKSLLKGTGVSEAIYLDMGAGWNYAWYRVNENSIIELHPKVHDYCTNWITFYRKL